MESGVQGVGYGEWGVGREVWGGGCGEGGVESGVWGVARPPPLPPGLVVLSEQKSDIEEQG